MEPTPDRTIVSTQKVRKEIKYYYIHTTRK